MLPLPRESIVIYVCDLKVGTGVKWCSMSRVFRSCLVGCA